MKKSILIFFGLVCLTSFSQNIVKEAIKTYNLQEIAYQLKLTPGSEHTIQTKFTVAKDGKLTQLEAFSEYPALREEALRILKTINKLTPREVRGHYVEQKISLPIIFKVETIKYREQRLQREARRKSN